MAVNSVAQTDTLIMPAPDTVPAKKIEVANFDLDAAGGNLLFKAQGADGLATFTVGEETTDLNFQQGVASMPLETDPQGKLLLIHSGKDHYKLYHVSQSSGDSYRVRHIPLWMSILPPLIAIILALIFKEVLISLFIGIWAGAFIAGGLRIDSFYYFFMSIFEVVQKYIVKALNDTGHLSVIIFSMLIGGMVAIISRNGGMAGVVMALSKYARSPRSAQFITWLLGVAIFFDDYANTLIVGNTMRPVTDRFRISREKLAYLVDSTAAPVAAIAFVTTWIGAELGYIGDGISQLKDFDANMTPYAIFISSLKYAFYPVLTLIFMLLIIFLRRDFGPMLKAEVRARTTGQVSGTAISEGETKSEDELAPVAGVALKWYNAVIPVLVVIFMTIFGLLDTGMASVHSELLEKGAQVASQGWGNVWGAMGALFEGEAPSFFIKLGKVIGSADSFVALLWASFSGVFVAVMMTLFAKIMKLTEAMETLTMGFKTMLPALLILTLAWSLAGTTEALHTATYLSTSLQDSLNPFLLPVIVFALSALISFSTGSSWSTMAIIYPIAIPITWAVCRAQGLDPEISMEIFFNVVAVVLSASVWGDHCSPISDTTILSSLASHCNHLDHVKTQLPYAMSTGLLSMAAAGAATLMGGGGFISFILLLAGVGLLTLLILRIGKKVDLEA